MNIWTQVDSNKNRSAFLIFFFVVFVIALGWLFSYIYNSPGILVIAILIAVTQALVSYYSGDSIVLAMSGAKEIKKSDDPVLWRVVENLAITAGLSMPRVYIIDDPAPNAFATGRDPGHASVAVTTGLLDSLEKTELEGVVAHEMSHVGNYDIRIMTMVAILVGVIALLSDLFIRARWLGFGRRDNREGGGQIQTLMLIVAIVTAILAPIIATIIQLAISRKREFLADADGALLTRYPEGLASALEKISIYHRPMKHVSTATAHLFINNPTGEKEKSGTEPGFFAKMFSTHPPIKERIKILRGMDAN